MARAKTVSQNMALLVSYFHSTGSDQSTMQNLHNITSVDFSWSQNKQDVISYGKLASRDRVAIDPPEVPLNFTYYLGAGINEYAIGFSVDATVSNESSLKFLLDKTKDEKNYYLFIAPEGADAEGLSGASSGCSVIGIGNAFVNSYSIEASVGDFPTVSIGVEGLNIKTYTGGVNQSTPAVNTVNGSELTGLYFTIPTISRYANSSIEPNVIRPGDIVVDISSAGGLFYNYSLPDVQSVRMGFDLNRAPINKLGSRFSVSKEIQFPINVNFEVSMLTKDLQTGSLSTFLCSTGKYNASIYFKYNTCSGDGSNAFIAELRNISLEGQQWSTQAGSDPQAVTTTWIGQIGGSGDLQNGLFMSGASIS